MKRVLCSLISVCFLALGLPVWGQYCEGDIKIQSRMQKDLGGMAEVSIAATKPGAAIFVDGAWCGTAPLKLALVPGWHYFIAQAQAYYPASASLMLEPNNSYSIILPMRPFSGFLSFTVDPPDSECFIDGERVSPPAVELNVGPHSLTVRRFGFAEQSKRIFIHKDMTSFAELRLVPTVFKASDFRLSRQRFNPDNKGSFGSTALLFKVSGYGNARLTLKNDAGAVLFTRDLAPFTTWSQSVFWDGRDAAGAAVPDGLYHMELCLWSTGGEWEDPRYADVPSPERPHRVDMKVTVDSSAKILPSLHNAGRPGLSFFPDPKIADMPDFSMDFYGGVIWRAPNLATASGAITMGGTIADTVALAAEIALESDTVVDLCAGISAGLFRAGSFYGGLHGRIAWSNVQFPSYPGAGSEAEFSMPLSFALSGLRVGLSPGVAVDLYAGAVTGSLAAGLWYESPSLVAGLSTRMRIGADGLATKAHPVEIAADMRYICDTVPLTLSLGLSAAIQSAGAAITLRAGIGYIL